MSETFANLAIERDGGVATLHLDRPDKFNALNRDLWYAIPDAVAALDRDPEVRVIILAGRGRGFCAGIDLVDHAPALAGGGALSTWKGPRSPGGASSMTTSVPTSARPPASPTRTNR
jgi:enoyl-CoA hydratase/carnithine racemase